MKTILVPLDGSPLAEQALGYARKLAPLMSARVRLLHAIDDTVLPDRMVNAGWLMALSEGATATAREPASAEALREEAEQYLLGQVMQLRGAGIDAEIMVRYGPAPEVIVEAAAQMPGALIAMATHGRSGLRRWALGSVADKVIHVAPAPVFLVRGDAPAPHAERALRRIMVPLDGSALAGRALPLAAELARQAQAELTLIQAVAPTIESYPIPLGQPISHYSALLPALREQAMVDLNIAASELRRQGLQVKTLVENGYPAEVIVDEASRRAIDLIVMATHGRSGVQRWALGSIADKVLHAAATPLLLVRAGAPDRGQRRTL